MVSMITTFVATLSLGWLSQTEGCHGLYHGYEYSMNGGGGNAFRQYAINTGNEQTRFVNQEHNFNSPRTMLEGHGFPKVVMECVAQRESSTHAQRRKRSTTLLKYFLGGQITGVPTECFSHPQLCLDVMICSRIYHFDLTKLTFPSSRLGEVTRNGP